MCGARRSTPTMTLNAILHIVPTDIARKGALAKATIRLGASRFLNEYMSEHLEILTRFDFIPELLDHGVAKPNSGEIFSAHIPTRRCGKVGATAEEC